jgi:hypothetical protein
MNLGPRRCQQPLHHVIQHTTHSSSFPPPAPLSPLQEGMLASSGWDEWTCVWPVNGMP